MEKRLLIILSICWLGLAPFIYKIYKSLDANSFDVLKANWNIELPQEANLEKIYFASWPDIGRDPINYYIFEYEDDEKMRTSFEWTEEGEIITGSTSTKSTTTIYKSTYREIVNKWLDKMGIPDDKYPKCDNCLYYYKMADDKSEIIMLLNSDEKILYIAEAFQ